jgi:hypothetical protein
MAVWLELVAYREIFMLLSFSSRVVCDRTLNAIKYGYSELLRPLYLIKKLSITQSPSELHASNPTASLP